MLKIFAKVGTNEKALVPVPQQAIRDAMQILNNKTGGSWVFVDKVKPGEGLLFSDNSKYQGFSTHVERYTDAIIVMDRFPKNVVLYEPTPTWQEVFNIASGIPEASKQYLMDNFYLLKR